MDRTQSYFVYNPPKSNNNGHSVRDRNLKRAAKKVIDGFSNNFFATTDNKLQLTLHYFKHKEKEVQKAKQTIEMMNQFFGPAKKEWDNTGYETMENTITWESNNHKILDVIDYVDSLKGENYLPLHKYWISVFYKYGVSARPKGHIMCSVESGRLFIRTHLVIPYPIHNEKCYELLSDFQNAIPFKLSGKHFKRLGPSENGYGQWKLDEETQSRLDASLTKAKTKKAATR